MTRVFNSRQLGFIITYLFRCFCIFYHASFTSGPKTVQRVANNGFYSSGCFNFLQHRNPHLECHTPAATLHLPSALRRGLLVLQLLDWHGLGGWFPNCVQSVYSGWLLHSSMLSSGLPATVFKRFWRAPYPCLRLLWIRSRDEIVFCLYGRLSCNLIVICQAQLILHLTMCLHALRQQVHPRWKLMY